MEEGCDLALEHLYGELVWDGGRGAEEGMVVVGRLRAMMRGRTRGMTRVGHVEGRVVEYFFV